MDGNILCSRFNEVRAKRLCIIPTLLTVSPLSRRRVDGSRWTVSIIDMIAGSNLPDVADDAEYLVNFCILFSPFFLRLFQPLSVRIKCIVYPSNHLNLTN